MRTIKIRITKEHLGAKYEDWEHCPLARAVREVFPHFKGVNTTWVMDENRHALAKINPPFYITDYKRLNDLGVEFETELTILDKPYTHE